MAAMTSGRPFQDVAWPHPSSSRNPIHRDGTERRIRQLHSGPVVLSTSAALRVAKAELEYYSIPVYPYVKGVSSLLRTPVETLLTLLTISATSDLICMSSSLTNGDADPFSPNVKVWFLSLKGLKDFRIVAAFVLHAASGLNNWNNRS